MPEPIDTSTLGPIKCALRDEPDSIAKVRLLCTYEYSLDQQVILNSKLVVITVGDLRELLAAYDAEKRA